MRFSELLFIAGLLGAATGCTSQIAEPELQSNACESEAALDYETFGSAFLTSWCTSCHSSELPEDMRRGAPIEVDLDSEDGARQWMDRIYVRAADDNTTMPPIGGPSDEERQLLGEWIECGMP